MALLYLDPGAGALMAQIIAAIAGGVILFKNTAVRWFKSIFGKKKIESADK
jgi:hypothetical protein